VTPDELDKFARRAKCSCGHDALDHTAKGAGRCTESADRASWYCPCPEFRSVDPIPALVAAVRAATAREAKLREAVQVLVSRARFDPGPAGDRHDGWPFVFTSDLIAALTETTGGTDHE